MSDVALVDKLPRCNFCEETARYDAFIVAGAWAYLCTEHWHGYTDRQLGTGLGQRLEVRKEG